MNLVKRELFGPGPTNVPDSVLDALSRPTIGHLDPQFLEIMDEINESLRYCFQTQNALTFVLSAPGSIGMETSFVNLVEPGEKVVICINGVFGGRMKDICRRIGAEVVTIENKWGTPVNPDELQKTLQAHDDAEIVAFVHAETSTGVRSDASTIARIAKSHDCLVIADCVTSLAGVELRVDDWELDVVYSGSQKCLSCVPGLSPITFSDAAVEKVKRRQTPVQSWFCDISLLMSYYESGEKTRAYHHTAPVNALFAMHQALKLVVNESLEARWARHSDAVNRLYARLEAAGLEMIVEEQHRLAPLTLVRVPDGISDAEIRQSLLAQNIEIGAGLGKFAGKAWRFGLMGENASIQRADFIADALLSTIESCR
ncbi:MAG: alanine--glyoxylate aminotransferase family protein [Gammaproteobacteria bacterium]|nr:alanine--glyoxylate aminotransferase family protein [Gammaproteobacteria bacterium]MDH3467621.1 alanine--glyoxylate aminotransferase family protein [Gammaproteobacteria bacterium]